MGACTGGAGRPAQPSARSDGALHCLANATPTSANSDAHGVRFEAGIFLDWGQMAKHGFHIIHKGELEPKRKNECQNIRS